MGKESSYYFSEMLKLWLEREDPRPSWRALIEALKKKEETELANRLQEQYGEWCSRAAHAHTEKLMSWHAGRSEEEVKEKNQEEVKEKNEEEGGGDKEVPDYKTQKQELQAVLQQRLRKGDTWYEYVHVPRHSG